MFDFVKRLLSKGKKEKSSAFLTKADLSKYPNAFNQFDISDAELFTDDEILHAQEVVAASVAHSDVEPNVSGQTNVSYAIGMGYKSGKDEAVAGLVRTDQIRHLDGEDRRIAVMRSGIELLKSTSGDVLRGQAGANLMTKKTNYGHRYAIKHVLGQKEH